MGFMISKADTSLFINNKASVIIYLLVYVDDIIVTQVPLKKLSQPFYKISSLILC
jgi:hypothetical protein